MEIDEDEALEFFKIVDDLIIATAKAQIRATGAEAPPDGDPYYDTVRTNMASEMAESGIAWKMPENIKEIHALVTDVAEESELIATNMSNDSNEQEKEETDEYMSADEELDQLNYRGNHKVSDFFLSESSSESSGDDENDHDDWKRLILSSLAIDHQWGSTLNEIQKVDYAKAVMQEMANQNEHDILDGCAGCQPDSAMKALRMDEPKYCVINGEVVINKPSPAAVAAELKCRMKYAKERLMRQQSAIPLEISADNNQASAGSAAAEGGAEAE